MLDHPLCRTCFGWSAAVGRLGDGVSYLMHKMQSGSWPHPHNKYRPLEHNMSSCGYPLKILASERSWLSRIVNAHMVCVSACRSTGGTGSTSMLLNDFCFLFLPLLSCLGTIVLQTHNRGDHKSSSVYLDSIETIHAVDQELKSPSY